MIRLLLLALPLLLPAPPARAWLREGHMATGAIAFDALERHDPDALRLILRTQAAHPERAWFERELGALTGRERARRTLELMAVWPDVARGGPLDHDDWHYSQVIVSSVRRVWPFAAGGARDAFTRNLRTARNPVAPDAERALALCWVMHVVGDMHQPLHAAVWLSWRFPLSDAGGNWAWVRTGPDAPPRRLHYVWDGAGRLDLPPGAAGSEEWVAALQRGRPFDAEPPVADPLPAFDGWTAESRALAYHVVYEAGALRPGVSPADAPVLPPASLDRLRDVGAERVARAGNRIGRLLLGLR